jgi:hypothetical protein
MQVRMDLKDAATVIAATIALITFIKGVYEYVRQGALRRAEFFLRLNERFSRNEDYQMIRSLLETNDPAISDVPIERRRDYACFFEEAAVLTNSGLLEKDFSIYFFGAFAVDIWDSKYFWFGLEKNSQHWDVLRNYVDLTKRQSSTHKRKSWIARF